MSIFMIHLIISSNFSNFFGTYCIQDTGLEAAEQGVMWTSGQMEAWLPNLDAETKSPWTFLAATFMHGNFLQRVFCLPRTRCHLWWGSNVKTYKHFHQELQSNKCYFYFGEIISELMFTLIMQSNFSGYKIFSSTLFLSRRLLSASFKNF